MGCFVASCYYRGGTIIPAAGTHSALVWLGMLLLDVMLLKLPEMYALA